MDATAPASSTDRWQPTPSSPPALVVPVSGADPGLVGEFLENHCFPVSAYTLNLWTCCPCYSVCLLAQLCTIKIECVLACCPFNMGIRRVSLVYLVLLLLWASLVRMGSNGCLIGTDWIGLCWTENRTGLGWFGLMPYKLKWSEPGGSTGTAAPIATHMNKLIPMLKCFSVLRVDVLTPRTC